jgi:hypothetical protein
MEFRYLIPRPKVYIQQLQHHERCLRLARQELPIFGLQHGESLANDAGQSAGKILNVPLLRLTGQASEEFC